MEHATYAAAARALLGDSATRSTNLMNRTRRAADAFGVSFETFRKRRNGRSPRDEVLLEVSYAVLALHRRADATLDAGADSIGTSEIGRPWRPSRRTLASAVVLVALGLVAAGLAWRRSTPSVSTVLRCRST